MSRILTNSDEDEAFIRERGLCESDAEIVRDMRRRLEAQTLEKLRGAKPIKPKVSPEDAAPGEE